MANIFTRREFLTVAGMTADGVHPTLAGHEVIAERWRAAMGL